MLKHFAGAILASLLAITAAAQKFDREYFAYQNTHLPSRLIYDQVKTYGVNVSANSSNMYTMDNNFANSLVVSFTSYDKTDYSNADMKLTVAYGPCSFVEEKTTSETREEEVNKVKVKVTYYRRSLSFRFPISYRIVNGKNNVTLYNNEFAAGNVRSIETGEFKSEADAVNYLNTNRNTFVANHINALCQDFMKNSNSSIRDQFDFFPYQTQMEIYQVKKWDKDDEYNGHVKNVVNIFKATSADEQPGNVREKLKSEIEYFQGYDGKFKADDKKEDILYFINNFNLATIFFCLDDFEKAKQYTKNLEASDKQEGSTRNLNAYIRSAETRMAKHFVTNTHLTYNPVKDYRLEGKTFQSDAASSTENMASSMSSGKVEAKDVVVMNDRTEITGKIIYVGERNELQVIPKNSPDKPVTINPSNCEKFTVDSLQYLSLKNMTSGGAIKQFFLVHHSSPKIKLVQYVNGALTPDNSYIGFIRPAEEVVTFGTGLGVKKKLAAYFEDCKELSEKAKDGDFGGAFSKDILGSFKKLCAEYDACK